MDTPLAKIMGTFYSKMSIFEAFLQDEGHLYSNFWIFILTIYSKCLLFQFLGCGMHKHIAILAGVQKGRTCRNAEMVIFCYKCIF